MAGRSGAIRAGSAFIEVFADKTRLDATLKNVSRTLDSFGSKLTRIGGAGLAGGLAAGSAFVAAATQFASAGDELNKMSLRTGVSVEALSELQFAAAQSGTDLKTLENGIRSMQRSVTGAGQGLSSYQRAFDELGITMSELNALSPEEQFSLISKRISEIEDPTRRAGIAMQVFGRSGQRMLPLLTSNISDLRAEARALGLQMSTEDAQAAADLTDAWSRVTHVFKRAIVAVGSALAPQMIELSGAILTGTVAVRQWVDINRELIAKAFMATGALIGVSAAVLGAGLALKAMGLVVGALLSPVGMAAIAAGTMGAAFIASSKAGKDAWGKMVQHVMSGDLVAAMETAKIAALTLWTELSFDLQAIWTHIAAAGKKTWTAITAIAAGELDILINLWKKAVFKIADMLTRIPGAEKVLGADPAAIRAELEEMLGGSLATTSLDVSFQKIDKEREKELKQQADRRAEALSGLKKRQAEVDRKAQKAAEEAQKKSDKPLNDRMRQRIVAAGNAATVGTFTGILAGQMAGVGPLERVEDTLKQIEEHAKKTAEATEEAAGSVEMTP